MRRTAVQGRRSSAGSRSECLPAPLADPALAGHGHSLTRGVTSIAGAKARAALVHALNERGYRTAPASTAEATQVARTVRPDLVVLEMAGDQGSSAMTSPGGLRAHSDPLLVLVSGEDRTASLLRAFEVGADDHVTKAYDIEELLACLRAVLRRSGRLGHAVSHVGRLVVERTRPPGGVGRSRDRRGVDGLPPASGAGPPRRAGAHQGPAPRAGVGLRGVRSAPGGRPGEPAAPPARPRGRPADPHRTRCRYVLRDDDIPAAATD
jgi:CheY-like chemotaxis protein